jgi:A/G-specific adenine glycosylase
MRKAEEDVQGFGSSILTWYALNQRNLPWRKTRNPYHIWVSEVMLQQTRVETVIPYYNRFLSRFPTVQTLASAPLDDVLKVWENMGYYARARYLHASAREVTERFNGKVPKTRDELLGLPGIGNYTASAILSIAFGQPVPAIDANVRRVMARLFAIDQPLEHSRTQRQTANFAGRLLHKHDPGLFNQALMDLGANICTPRTPRCTVCPVRSFCTANQRDLQDDLPVTRKRAPIPHNHATAGIIADALGRILVVRRPDKGLLGGLWKFPGGLQEADETLEKCLRRRVREEVGIQIRVGKPITSVNHAYTHFRITLHAFQCRPRTGKPRPLGCTDWHWTGLHQLKDLAFSRVDRKIIDVLTSRITQAAA